MKAELIAPASLGTVWADALPWVETAMDRGGRFEPEDIRSRVENSQMQLWIARDAGGVSAVCVTEILEYPRCRVFSIVILTGRERENWIDQMDALKAQGRQWGCNRIEAWARPGWKRVLTDWRHTHSLLEADL